MMLCRLNERAVVVIHRIPHRPVRHCSCNFVMLYYWPLGGKMLIDVEGDIESVDEA